MRSLLILFSCGFLASAQQSEPLRRVGAVALPGVQGRIDHLSVDLNNQRLFVAAMGNNTIEIIDLKNSKRIHSIPGLAEPQGVLYVPPAAKVIAPGGRPAAPAA
jgi:YVTN family beta-propeller protein